MPDDKTISTDVPPVVVTVVGSGDGLADKTKAVTPHNQPNILVQVVTPALAILIRFVNTYIGMIVGLLAIAMADNKAIPAADFGQLFVKCAGLALGGAVVLSLKDIVTIFGKLEGKFPLWTGNV